MIQSYQSLTPTNKTIADVAFMAFLNWLEHSGKHPTLDDMEEDVLDSMCRFISHADIS